MSQLFTSEITRNEKSPKLQTNNMPNNNLQNNDLYIN